MNADSVVDVPWVVVAPEFPEHPDSGWSIWTRGLNPNRRIVWREASFDDTELLLRHIADSHNAEARRNA